MALLHVYYYLGELGEIIYLHMSESGSPDYPSLNHLDVHLNVIS